MVFGFREFSGSLSDLIPLGFYADFLRIVVGLRMSCLIS
jgi:hypothetical protein